MDIETIYKYASAQSQRRWFEYLKINGGAARIVVSVAESHARAVLSLWTLERGYQPFIALPEPEVRKGTLEQAREQLLSIADGMLRFRP